MAANLPVPFPHRSAVQEVDPFQDGVFSVLSLDAGQGALQPLFRFQLPRVGEEVQLIMDKKEFFDYEIWGYETKKIDDTNIDFKMSSFISTNVAFSEPSPLTKAK